MFQEYHIVKFIYEVRTCFIICRAERTTQIMPSRKKRLLIVITNLALREACKVLQEYHIQQFIYEVRTCFIVCGAERTTQITPSRKKRLLIVITNLALREACKVFQEYHIQQFIYEVRTCF